MAELDRERLKWVEGATEGHPTFLLAGPVTFIYAFWSIWLILCSVYVCVCWSVPQFLGSALDGRSPDDAALQGFSLLLEGELRPAAPLGLMSQRRE